MTATAGTGRRWVRRARRWAWIVVITILLLAAIAFLADLTRMVIGRKAINTGWLLFAIILALTLYGVRKKLRTIPIGRASLWLNVHLYLGFVTAAIFILHINGRWPWGDLEILLTLSLSTVLLSGLGGWILDRVFAIRLGRRGTEVIYERIPAHTHRLRQEAEAVMLRVAEETGSSTLPEFYLLRLAQHFAGPRNRWSHILGSARPEVATGREITAVERYLDDREKRALASLAELVKLKHDLDFHRALQWALKFWLFIHVPATTALLIFILVHILLVYAFGGATP